MITDKDLDHAQAVDNIPDGEDVEHPDTQYSDYPEVAQRLTEYLKDIAIVNYVGDIYGPDAFTATGAETSEMLEDLGETAVIVDHPAYGGGEGYYLQSGDLYYNNGLGDHQLIFEIE